MRTLDGGHCAAAISLDLPGRNDGASLQQLINSWHHQHTIQALLLPPPLHILRLSRFLATRRSFRKHVGRVSWGRVVWVPFSLVMPSKRRSLSITFWQQCVIKARLPPQDTIPLFYISTHRHGSATITLSRDPGRRILRTPCNSPRLRCIF